MWLELEFLWNMFVDFSAICKQQSNLGVSGISDKRFAKVRRQQRHRRKENRARERGKCNQSETRFRKLRFVEDEKASHGSSRSCQTRAIDQGLPRSPYDPSISCLLSVVARSAPQVSFTILSHAYVKLYFSVQSIQSHSKRTNKICTRISLTKNDQFACLFSNLLMTS